MRNLSVPEFRQKTFLDILHYNTEVIDADRQGKSPYDFSETVTAEITKIKERLIRIQIFKNRRY